MASPHDPGGFASRLMRQDKSLSDSQYQEYRMKLESALAASERKERLAGRVAVVSCVLMLALMFVGGSKVLGEFDPWSKGANAVSVAAGVAYWIATATFFLSLASYFSRFRPNVKGARDRLRDATILDLQRQVRELREQVDRNSGKPNPD